MSDDRVLPPPEVTSRDPWPAGLEPPRGVRDLQRGAEAAGWLVTLTYSRGWCLPHKIEDPPYRVHTIAVRFLRDLGGRTRGGHVVYHSRVDNPKGWSAKSLLVWGSDHWPVVSVLGVTDVGRYLVDGPEWTGAQVAEWAQGLRVKVAEAKQRAAEAARARPKKAKVI